MVKKNKKRGDIPPGDARELLLDSRGYCCNPDCEHRIQPRNAKTGVFVLKSEVAHIIAAEDDGPRGDPTFPDDERERYDNLIILCKFCHPEVDHPDHYEEYPASLLREWKKIAQTKRKEQVSRIETPQGYEELSQLLGALATSDFGMPDGFDRVKVEEKFEINQLGDAAKSTISKNLYHMPVVDRALASGENKMIGFADGVKITLKRLYLDLKRSGLESDEIFRRMVLTLVTEGDEFRTESVSELVLSFFFEKCVIFERA